MRLIALAPSISLLAGCGFTSSARHEAAFLVTRGAPPPIDQNDERTLSTVGLVTYKRNVFCTGTLIADDIVATAAHCL